MTDYGITPHGFEIKPFTAILGDMAGRAREMFGGDVDLRSTSALRKILDLAAYEQHELWKKAEQLYYSQFISTAAGDALDLLGDDLGLARRFLFARGTVKFTLAGAAPDRIYNLPLGTLVETGAPTQVFRTLKLVSLSEDETEAEVNVEAWERGPAGNVPTGAINTLNALFAEKYLRLGGATVAVTNEQSTVGGDQLEADESYRDALLGYPRTLWTFEAVRNTVRAVDGVRDCRLLDPAGGVDVSLSKFNQFAFGRRRFASQRLYGTPYRFEILVALQPGVPWESGGGVTGVRERVDSAIRSVRPISIFPNLRRANHVRVAVRARVLVAPGHDRDSVVTAIADRLERRINALGLGRSVLYSEVVTDAMSVAGVIDITQLRLRRCPPLHSRVNFGRRGRFQSAEIELPVGENLDLEPDEIAEFKIDSRLLDVEVSEK